MNPYSLLTQYISNSSSSIYWLNIPFSIPWFFFHAPLMNIGTLCFDFLYMCPIIVCSSPLILLFPILILKWKFKGFNPCRVFYISSCVVMPSSTIPSELRVYLLHNLFFIPSWNVSPSWWCVQDWCFQRNLGHCCEGCKVVVNS